MPASEPIPGWWESPALAFAEGARVASIDVTREVLQLAEELYGPWHRFDAAALVRALEARGRWPLPAPDPGGSVPGSG